MWPGVSELPDYKNSFPKWPPQNVANIVPTLDSAGHDLLRVCFIFTEIMYLSINIVIRKIKK